MATVQPNQNADLTVCHQRVAALNRQIMAIYEVKPTDFDHLYNNSISR